MADAVARLAADPAAAATEIAQSPLAPGVGVAGIVDGVVTTGFAGVDDDFVFRPGSITKLLTATLVVQCAEEELCDLDDPVTKFVPRLEIGEYVPTLRHLITHASGIDAGDVFVDTGDDDGALARYVESVLGGAGFLFAPGTAFSYGNGAFVLAGHVVSLLRDATWEDVMHAHLFAPLGMESSRFETMDASYTVRSLGPAGGTLVSTPHDLGRFLADQLARPERAWMRKLAAPAPGGVALMQGAGAAWMVWHGSCRIGGANPGMSGYLATDPTGSVGLVALTNGDVGVNAVAAILDADAPTPPDPGPPPTDLSVFEGTYESHAMRVVVEVHDGELMAEISGARAPLTPIDAHTCDSMLGPVAFFDGMARWRMRVMKRLAC